MGGSTIDIEIVKIVLTNIFSVVTLAWSSGMVWWLSSAVFIVTLITKLYPNKKIFKKSNIFIPVGIFSSLFILSLITFGAVVIYDLSSLETAIYDLISISISGYSLPSVLPIFSIVRKLYVIVTTTLILFLIAWIYMWFYDNSGASINGE
jgi:hypothetical protein